MNEYNAQKINESLAAIQEFVCEICECFRDFARFLAGALSEVLEVAPVSPPTSAVLSSEALACKISGSGIYPRKAAPSDCKPRQGRIFEEGTFTAPLNRGDVIGIVSLIISILGLLPLGEWLSICFS